MGKISGQVFSLEILFATIMIFLLFFAIDSLESKKIELDNTQQFIEDYADSFFYSLIKTNKIQQAISSNNYDYIKSQMRKVNGLCQQIEIYQQNLQQSSLKYSYNTNCTINREKSEYIQKIFFDGGENDQFYIIKIKIYRE